jgi:hypothetical protein
MFCQDANLFLALILSVSVVHVFLPRSRSVVASGRNPVLPWPIEKPARDGVFLPDFDRPYSRHTACDGSGGNADRHYSPVLENEDVFDLAFQNVDGELKMMKEHILPERFCGVG